MLVFHSRRQLEQSVVLQISKSDNGPHTVHEIRGFVMMCSNDYIPVCIPREIMPGKIYEHLTPHYMNKSH